MIKPFLIFLIRFLGRQVLIRESIDARPSSKTFLKKATSLKSYLVTNRAWIKGYKNHVFEIEVESENGKNCIIAKTKEEVLQLNNPHIFEQDAKGFIVFEDGIKCNYSAPRVKAKLTEMALELAPLIEKLDFRDKDCWKVQIECVKAIRKCLDLVSFERGVDKGRIGRSDSVGKLAINGQAQCHGLSSVMCAFLMPFAPVLGIDIKYRGGSSFSNLEEGLLSNAENHQWLELSFRPSMKTFACDLWYGDAFKQNPRLITDIDEAYRLWLHPHGKFIVGTTSSPEEKNDIAI